MGALKVGDLYVAVTASIGEAVANLGKLVKKVEDTAKKVKEAADPIGKIGAVVAAGIGGAVVAASKSNARLAAEVEHIQEVLYTFAAEVGDLFTPLVRRIGDFLSNLVAHFQRLSPQAKRAAASLAAWTAGVGLGIGFVGKLAATVEGLAKGFGIALQGVKAVLPIIGQLGPVLNGVGPAATKAWQALQAMKNVDVGAGMSKLWTTFKAMTPTMKGVGEGFKGLGKSMVEFVKATPSMLSSVLKMLVSFGGALVPILAIAAALAAITLLAGSIYKSWGDIGLSAMETWQTISEFMGKMMTALGNVAHKLADVFVIAFDAVTESIKAQVKRALDFAAFLVRGASTALEPIANALGMGNAKKAFAAGKKLQGDDLMTGAEKLWEGTEGVRQKLAQAAENVAEVAGEAGAQFGKDVVWAGKKFWDYQTGWLTGDGMKHSAEGVKMFVGDILKSSGAADWEDRLKSFMGLLGGNAEARIRQPGDLNGDLRQKSYDQLQAYENEAVRREADRAAAADEENAAKSLESLANAADQATDELEWNRDRSSEAREELAAAARTEMEAAQEANISIWRDAQRLAEEAKVHVGAAIAALLDGFVARMGEFGQLYSTATQAFKDGGWWAALVAVIGELVMGSDQMAEAIAVLNGVIGMLKDLLGAAATGLDTIMGGVGYLVSVIVEVVQPSMEAMGEAMESIAPIIVLVGMVLKMLAPALDAIGKATAWLLDNVLKGLFQVLRYVAIAILYVIKGLGSAWNGIVSAIQWVFRQLGDISIFGAHPLGFLRGWANSMESAKVDVESLARNIQELEDLTWDAALAKARETAEVLKNRDALEDVNEALSNVPALWKVALRRFDVQDEQNGPTTSTGTQPSPSMPTTPTTPGSEVLPPISRGGDVSFGLGGPLQDLLDRIMGGSNAAGTASAAAMPPVQYNITGYDITDAMAQARQDYEDRQRRASIRLYGTAAAVGPRYA
ncbi:hypothetical protein [Corallococcus exiguus]|uniref:Uncharacterized protein n=1 Tax=Corallococcus exiguus TaxID=83462 RepID=A0A7X4Y7R5_9BACT|nr:hypothetical protein [Corallococcus exiguus]NBC40475.1 hypothetical protein [Corallococcus exiguus]TNV64042.1 hypothetical protein FH620_13465 [Corallococcus exiguus]